jgi:ribokinase
MGPKILVIGSSNVDMIMALPKLPSVGEAVTDGSFMQTFGGKGANQAIAAARAGGRVSFMTCVGDDDGGRAVMAALAKDGIDVSLSVVAPGEPTGAALVMFDVHGDNYLAVAPGSNYSLRPQHIDAIAPRFAEFAMLLLQFEIPADTLQAALETAATSGVPVLFNHAPARVFTRSIPGRVALVVNELEAATLIARPISSREEVFAAAGELRNRGFEFVIVTFGRGGSFVRTAEETFHVPAIPSKAVDTTAAGDTFCGALAVALAVHRSMREAMKFATAAAAICVRRAGARPSIPSFAEIQALVDNEGGPLPPYVN